MKQKRYTEEQIAFALRQAEVGIPVAEVPRKMGIIHDHHISFLENRNQMLLYVSHKHITIDRSINNEGSH
ncbi:hypothetical protein HG66A1_52940 [Gimesia chilikensis]|jgi:hypothetical protein|uniref:Transposase n=1 Tax=Gimesia chilikensis TaxID=2605989 RepID=A0A517PVS9_9PLAN|nr:hypothetical protein HG66A1_52940 [Gimesia chilikensis]